jgi:hypothetical protein
MIENKRESVYQQTENVYRPTIVECEYVNEKKAPRCNILSRLRKIKNPISLPTALLTPDRSVIILIFQN